MNRLDGNEEESLEDQDEVEIEDELTDDPQLSMLELYASKCLNDPYVGDEPRFLAGIYLTLRSIESALRG